MDVGWRFGVLWFIWMAIGWGLRFGGGFRHDLCACVFVVLVICLFVVWLFCGFCWVLVLCGCGCFTYGC